MKKILFLLVALGTSLGVQAQWGCPDPQATNYSAVATQNDGSCLYSPTSYTLPVRDTLDSLLHEVSGMIYRNGKLYAHNDGGSPNHLYELDTTTGAITKTIVLGTKTNIDWEDMTQSSTHIFIGDFGNNLGTRQNLVIYKFPAALLNQAGTTITIPDAQIESIQFSYPDQTSFVSDDSTRFDCEAMAWRNNALHLFSKNHGGGACYHYRVSDTAGTYTATLLDSLNTQQVEITAADFAANKQLMLIGYQTFGLANCVLWYVYDFSSADSCFAKGNKRRIDLGSALNNGQVEGLCFSDTTGGFVCSELFVVPPPLSGSVPNKLYRFKTSAWYPYIYPNSVSDIDATEPSAYVWNGESIELTTPGRLQVYTLSGQLVGKANEVGLRLPVVPGVYIIQWQGANKKVQREKRILR
jgi:hypothetical protein